MTLHLPTTRRWPAMACRGQGARVLAVSAASLSMKSLSLMGAFAVAHLIVNIPHSPGESSA